MNHTHRLGDQMPSGFHRLALVSKTAKARSKHDLEFGMSNVNFEFVRRLIGRVLISFDPVTEV